MKTIIEMAREAGMAGFDGVVHAAFQLEAFADLVRADERKQRTWIWLSDADIRETIDSICEYSGDYDEVLCKKLERKIKEFNT